MIHDLTVACVLKSGGVYDETYVHRLYQGIRRFLPEATRFVCLSDVWVPGVENIPLTMDLPGWWSKQELFAPGVLDDGGLVLYLDLDTVLVGPISEIAGYTGTGAVLRDLYRPNKMIGSGIMLWRGRALEPIWEAFSKDPAEIMRAHIHRSDYFMEPFLRDADRIQDLFPGWVASYKRNIKQIRRIPEETRIVCLHGRPRLHDLPEDDPVAVAWRANEGSAE